MIWKSEYAIGIHELDKQHETLLAFITDFEKVVEGRAHLNTLAPLIARTREFVKYHFTVEESLMQLVDYPQFVAHRAEHQNVLTQFEMLEQRVLHEETKGEVLPLVHTWLFRHSIDSDRPLAEYAIGKRGAMRRIAAG